LTFYDTLIETKLHENLSACNNTEINSLKKITNGKISSIKYHSYTYSRLEV